MSENIIKFQNSIEYEILTSEFGIWLLEQYKLTDKIYESSISQIYLLEDNNTGELFTLKVIINKDMFGDLEILKEIRHPNIVSIKHVFKTEKYVFIVQDYIKGLTLKEYVEKNGVLSEQKLVEVAFQLCNIFEYLHTSLTTPLIFRDLKPANIIISDNGELKLIDLASIRLFKKEAENDTIHIGTIGFAAPEQFGYGQTDVRSDIYTLGATLYYLLIGNKPISDKLNIKNIKNVRKEISVELAEVIDKCTRFSPDERFQNITDLKSALNRVGKKSIFTKLKYFSRARYFKLLTVSVVILAISFGIYFYSFSPREKAEANATKIQDNKVSVKQEEVSTQESEAFSYEKTTIVDAFWSGTIPEKLPRNVQIMFEDGPPSQYSDNTFHIAIKEWDNTKDYKQMAERVFRVDNKLILRAEGYKDVQADISPGSITAGDGSGQVYVCFLNNKENMVSGVKYKLVDNSGHWIIPDDLYIERPIK